MLRRNRLYRVLRVAVSVLLVLPRYAWLLARQRLGIAAPAEAAWQRAHEGAARALERLGNELGGLFIKVCQVVGARADFLPEPFIRRLARFHDEVPPRPFRELERHLARELGRPPADVFSRIDERPLAAASLAQVHRARLRDGPEVVLKIQYPEARRIFSVDLASVRRVARLIQRLNPALELRNLVEEMAHFISLELDFELEAESTERVRACLGDDPRVRIPQVHGDLSTDRLLVLEYLEGIKITAVDELVARGFDLHGLAERVAALYGDMIFEHGFFQGDPHPGNLLVLPDGRIGLLDFGLAKELPPGFGAGVAALLTRSLAGDVEGSLEAARSIGFETRPGDRELFPRLVRVFLGDYSGLRPDLDVVRQLPIARVPSHITLVLRVAVILNGLSHMLVPGERVIPLALARSLAAHAASGAATGNPVESGPKAHARGVRPGL